MKDYPNIDLLTGLMEEIEDLKQARILLEELWYSIDSPQSCRNQHHLEYRIKNYLRLSKGEGE